MTFSTDDNTPQEPVKQPTAPAPTTFKDDEQVSLEQFQEAARAKYGIPKNLMKAMLQQESQGGKDLTSPTGVSGPWQVTEAVAKQYGLDRNDPFHNVAAGARYLKEQYDALGDIKDENERWLGAVGRYYGGPSAVQGGVADRVSRDGLSNPVEHLERVAKNWRELGLDGVPQGNPALAPAPEAPPQKIDLSEDDPYVLKIEGGGQGTAPTPRTNANLFGGKAEITGAEKGAVSVDPRAASSFKVSPRFTQQEQEQYFNATPEGRRRMAYAAYANTQGPDRDSILQALDRLSSYEPEMDDLSRYESSIPHSEFQVGSRVPRLAAALRAGGPQAFDREYQNIKAERQQFAAEQEAKRQEEQQAISSMKQRQFAPDGGAGDAALDIASSQFESKLRGIAGGAAGLLSGITEELGLEGLDRSLVEFSDRQERMNRAIEAEQEQAQSRTGLSDYTAAGARFAGSLPVAAGSAMAGPGGVFATSLAESARQQPLKAIASSYVNALLVGGASGSLRQEGLRGLMAVGGAEGAVNALTTVPEFAELYNARSRARNPQELALINKQLRKLAADAVVGTAAAGLMAGGHKLSANIGKGRAPEVNTPLDAYSTLPDNIKAEIYAAEAAGEQHPVITDLIWKKTLDRASVEGIHADAIRQAVEAQDAISQKRAMMGGLPVNPSPVLQAQYQRVLELNALNHAQYMVEGLPSLGIPDAGTPAVNRQITPLASYTDRMAQAIQEVAPDFPVDLSQPGATIRTKEATGLGGRLMDSTDPDAIELGIKLRFRAAQAEKQGLDSVGLFNVEAPEAVATAVHEQLHPQQSKLIERNIRTKAADEAKMTLSDIELSERIAKQHGTQRADTIQESIANRVGNVRYTSSEPARTVTVQGESFQQDRPIYDTSVRDTTLGNLLGGGRYASELQSRFRKAMEADGYFQDPNTKDIEQVYEPLAKLTDRDFLRRSNINPKEAEALVIAELRALNTDSDAVRSLADHLPVSQRKAFLTFLEDRSTQAYRGITNEAKTATETQSSPRSEVAPDPAPEGRGGRPEPVPVNAAPEDQSGAPGRPAPAEAGIRTEPASQEGTPTTELEAQRAPAAEPRTQPEQRQPGNQENPVKSTPNFDLARKIRQEEGPKEVFPVTDAFLKEREQLDKSKTTYTQPSLLPEGAARATTTTVDSGVRRALEHVERLHKLGRPMSASMQEFLKGAGVDVEEFQRQLRGEIKPVAEKNSQPLPTPRVQSENAATALETQNTGTPKIPKEMLGEVNDLRSKFRAGKIKPGEVIELSNGVKIKAPSKDSQFADVVGKSLLEEGEVYGRSAQAIRRFWANKTGEGERAVSAILDRFNLPGDPHTRDAQNLAHRAIVKMYDNPRMAPETIGRLVQEEAKAGQKLEKTGSSLAQIPASDLYARLKTKGLENSLPPDLRQIGKEVAQGRRGHVSLYNRKLKEASESASASTQRAITTGSYKKISEDIKRIAPSAKSVLDYGAGLGLGVDYLREGLATANVESYEPFPGNWKGKQPPTYTDAGDISGKYDVVTNANVLNVLRKPLRDEVVKDIYDKIAPGGTGIIITRGWNGDISPQKGTLGAEPKSKITSDGVYQKGWDGNELVEYLKEVVPGAKIEKYTGAGKNGAIIRKPEEGSVLYNRKAGQKDESGFYSQLEKTIDQKFGKTVSLPEMERALRNSKEVKADELKWSGLDDFLTGKSLQGISKVPKEEVLRYIQANSAKLKVKEKWVNAKLSPEMEERITSLKKESDELKSVIYSLAEAKEKLKKEYRKIKFLEGMEDRKIEIQKKINSVDTDLFRVFSKQDDINREVRSLSKYETTKYEDYATHGGEPDSYKEVLLTLNDPYRREESDFSSPHWDEQNVLSHARIDDRADVDGNPVRHVHEIQSDWHQAGRKEGYKKDVSKERTEYQELTKRIDAISEEIRSLQDERWSTGRKDNETGVEYLRRKNENIRKLQEETDALKEKRSRITDTLYANANRPADAPLQKTWHETTFRKLVQQAAEDGKARLTWDTGETNSMRYPGAQSMNSNYKAGMYSFYDRVLPEYAKKFARKWGAKVGTTEVSIGEKVVSAYFVQESYGNNDRLYYEVLNESGRAVSEPFNTAEEALNFYENLTGEATPKKEKITQKVHFIEINDAMRESVTKEGVALYNRKQQKTPEFKEWFKDSKVVDKKGNPLSVYHGTRGNFDVFNTKPTDKEPGSHFGTRKAAEEFTRNYKGEYWDSSNIIPVYLNIKNPVEVSDVFGVVPKKLSNELVSKKILTEEEAKKALGTYYPLTKEEMRAAYEGIVSALKSKGYDGFKYTNYAEDRGSTSWVVFDPTQIKSAIGNKGTFDQNNPSILYNRTPKKASDKSIEHPSDLLNGKKMIGRTGDGRVIVRNPENKTGVSVVKDRSFREVDTWDTSVPLYNRARLNPKEHIQARVAALYSDKNYDKIPIEEKNKVKRAFAQAQTAWNRGNSKEFAEKLIQAQYYEDQIIGSKRGKVDKTLDAVTTGLRVGILTNPASRVADVTGTNLNAQMQFGINPLRRLIAHVADATLAKSAAKKVSADAGVKFNINPNEKLSKVVPKLKGKDWMSGTANGFTEGAKEFAEQLVKGYSSLQMESGMSYNVDRLQTGWKYIDKPINRVAAIFGNAPDSFARGIVFDTVSRQLARQHAEQFPEAQQKAEFDKFYQDMPQEAIGLAVAMTERYTYNNPNRASELVHNIIDNFVAEPIRPSARALANSTFKFVKVPTNVAAQGMRLAAGPAMLAYDVGMLYHSLLQSYNTSTGKFDMTAAERRRSIDNLTESAVGSMLFAGLAVGTMIAKDNAYNQAIKKNVAGSYDESDTEATKMEEVREMEPGAVTVKGRTFRPGTFGPLQRTAQFQKDFLRGTGYQGLDQKTGKLKEAGASDIYAPKTGSLSKAVISQMEQFPLVGGAVETAKFLDPAKGDMAKSVANTITPGIAREIGSYTDENRRVPRKGSLWDNLKNNFGAGNDMPARINAAGEPVTKRSGASIWTKKYPESKGLDEVERLGLSLPRHNVSEKDSKYTMKEQEGKAVFLGQTIKAATDKVVTSTAYQKAKSDEEKAQMLNDVIQGINKSPDLTADEALHNAKIAVSYYSGREKLRNNATFQKLAPSQREAAENYLKAQYNKYAVTNELKVDGEKPDLMSLGADFFDFASDKAALSDLIQESVFRSAEKPKLPFERKKK